LWVRPGAYPRVECLKGYAQALLANFKLGLKVLPGTNTLAYYEYVMITAVKSFMTSGVTIEEQK
jgi:hypothetical protein